jgi:H+-translocating NAD(P) transhydrogenase subunit alpha
MQQQIVKETVLHADIVISSARQANTVAPVLIPLTTLQVMQKGTVVVDMALSEGGNVYGSKHDETIILGNDIYVINVSGYPKAVPHEASIAWSGVSLKYVLQLLK